MSYVAQNREDGGRLVREAWMYWASRQPNPKPSWLTPWQALSESDKEADRVIWDEIVSPYVTTITQLVEENVRLRRDADRVQAFHAALGEIGTTAANALVEQGVGDWAEGGALGDALLGIKAIVETTLEVNRRS